MIRAYDVVDFLRGQGELVAQPALPHEQAWEPVTGVARFEEATPGALCWISEKNYALAASLLVPSFRGALLLAPPSAASEVAQWPRVVACRAPKVAFAKVVWRFFPELCDTHWPNLPSVDTGLLIGGDVVMHDDLRAGPHTVIAHARIGRNVVIGANCTIGLPGFGYERDAGGKFIRFPHVGRVVIGDDVEIGSNTCIDRGALGDTVIEGGVKIDNLVHIAHNALIGEGALVIAHAMIGGSAQVMSRAWVAPCASVLNQVRIGAGATVGMGAVVLKDVAADAVVVGNPARVLDPKPVTLY
jgi:UDP-3-O-[3-hydroxymyristoyl] glucosamine N-acyltransferase